MQLVVRALSLEDIVGCLAPVEVDALDCVELMLLCLSLETALPANSHYFVVVVVVKCLQYNGTVTQCYLSFFVSGCDKILQQKQHEGESVYYGSQFKLQPIIVGRTKHQELNGHAASTLKKQTARNTG